jgi:4-hydroxy-tetrahydrodipicolinate synthase
MQLFQFTGTGVALPTPFNDHDEIDFHALGHLVDELIAKDVDFLVPCGTTGESPTITHEEQIAIIKFTVELVKGKVPILAGTGSNNTKEAVRLTAAAKDAGADGSLQIAPYYNKPMPKGYLNHFRKIAEVGLPVMLYDIPGRTGKGVPIEVIMELALEESIFGIKWASGDFNQLMQLQQELSDDFVILSGDDNLTLPAIACGASGVISVAANIVPEEVKDLCFFALNDQLSKAQVLHQHYLPLFKALFMETNPIPLKEALAIIYPELFLPNFRSPLSNMESQNRQILVEILADYNLKSKL